MKFHDVAINGETFSLPSCTGIIELARERGMLVGDQWLTWNEEGLGFGTQIHKLIAFILQGAVIPKEDWATYEETERQCLRAFKRWWDFTSFKPRAAEFELYSIAYGVVGHPDAIGTIKQHVELIDWTTGAVNTGKLLQLGFYYLAYKETYPRRTIRGARAVHLDKQTGDFNQKLLTEADLQGYAQDFVKIREEIGVI
jgi:hypothetical protein